MSRRFKVVVVPPDEVHIVNTGKGQFLHTSVKNPKYWLTPWKHVYKIPTKPILLQMPNFNVKDSSGLSIYLDMEVVFKLRDPELAVKSLGADVQFLKNTLERLIGTTTRQISQKFPAEGNTAAFQSSIIKEAQMTIQGLSQMLGFDIISFDITNNRLNPDATCANQPVLIPVDDNGGKIEQAPVGLMNLPSAQTPGPNGGDEPNPNALERTPLLPVVSQASFPPTVPNAPAAQQMPTAQQMPAQQHMPAAPLNNIAYQNPQEEVVSFSAPRTSPGMTAEDMQIVEDMEYDEKRARENKNAFDNFQYSRDDLKWGGNEEVPSEMGSQAYPYEEGVMPEQMTLTPANIQQPSEAEADGSEYPPLIPVQRIPIEEYNDEPDISKVPDQNFSEQETLGEIVAETITETETRESTTEAWEWDGEEEGEETYASPEDEYRKKAEGVIREIKGIISRIRRKGMVLPPSPINTYLTNITDNIENGHYLDATKIGRECLTYLEETEVIFENIRDEVIKLQDQITTLKDGKVPIDDVEDKFNLVIALFKKAEYDEAKAEGEICRKLLDKKKSLYEQADNAIKEAWQLMKHAAPLGWEVSKARTLLDDAKRATENEEYQEALEKAKLAQDVIQAHFDSLKGIWLKIREIGEVATKAHEDSLTDIQASLDKFGEKMDEILTLGVKITPALNEELSEVEDALAKHDIYGAKHLIEDLETTIEELKDQHERARLKFDRARLLIEETRRVTKDIRPMMYLMGEMEAALKSGEYEVVSDMGDQLSDLCRERDKDDALFKSLGMMESAGRIAEECKELGMDVIDVNPLLRDGIISFRQENYQRAFSKSELAYKILLEAKARYLVISSRRIIETTEEELTGPKEDLLTELEDIEWILDRGEPESAMDRLRKMRLVIFEQKFLERLRNAEGMVRWLEDKKINIEEEKKLVLRAKLSFNEQDFKMATKIINRAIEELDSVEQYERIIHEMKSTVAIIEEMEAKGLDVSAVKEKIAELKPIIDGDLESRSNVTAMGFVHECKQMAMDLKKGHEVKLKITRLEKKLSKLEMDGISAPSIWRLIQKVYKSLGSGDIRKANSMAERVEGRIEEEVQLFKRDKAVRLREFKKKAVKLFKEGKQEGALKYFNKALKFQPKDEKLLYNKAVVLKNLDRYVEAIQFCNRALTLNESYDQARKLRETCRNKLRSEGKIMGRYVEPSKAYDYANLRYTPQEDVGLDFKGIRGLISEIVADLKDQGGIEFSDFNIEDFSDTSGMIGKSNPLVEMMARDLLFNTKKMIEESDIELEVPRKVILDDLKQIENLLDKGNLAVIVKELQKIRGLLYENIDDDDVLITWKKIMETRRNEPSKDEFDDEETDIIDQTRPAYEEGDLMKAIEMIKNDRVGCGSEDDQEISEKLLQDLIILYELMNDLVELGGNIREVKKELTLLTPAIEMRFYRKAEGYVNNAMEIAMELKGGVESSDLKGKAKDLIDVIENDLGALVGE